mmetsp:Transcript_18086/g.27127  ORF Transcript_18086/g.27127 Transcript_18086/m.27127 type:complete len:571 (-) Transcript_18086:75-1787(-)
MLLLFGANDWGQLGRKKDDCHERKAPSAWEPREPTGRVRLLSCGAQHTVAVCENGVFTCGVGDKGALGRKCKDEEEQQIPLIVSKLPRNDPIQMITCGDTHTMMLMNSGQVWGFGLFRNSSASKGSLGFIRPATKKQDAEEAEPVRIKGLSNITMIASGGNHCLAMDNEGRVLQWGDACSKNRDTMKVEERLRPHLAPVPMERMISKVFAGAHSNFVVLDSYTEPTVYAWGLNNNGQLGTKDTLPEAQKSQWVFEAERVKSVFGQSEVKKIAAGDYHTLFLTVSGQIFSCGNHHYGKLGLGADLKNDQHIPALIETISPKTSKEVKFTDIDASEGHSVACTASGSVYTWGTADSMQLGNRDGSKDLWIPTHVKGRQLDGYERERDSIPRRRVNFVACGSVHTAVIAVGTTEMEVDNKKTSSSKRSRGEIVSMEKIVSIPIRSSKRYKVDNNAQWESSRDSSSNKLIEIKSMDIVDAIVGLRVAHTAVKEKNSSVEVVFLGKGVHHAFQKDGRVQEWVHKITRMGGKVSVLKAYLEEYCLQASSLVSGVELIDESRYLDIWDCAARVMKFS